MAVQRKLVMTFKTAADKKVSLSVDSPRTDLTEQEVVDSMNLILSKNIFESNGSGFAGIVDAKVVKTDTTDYDLVV